MFQMIAQKKTLRAGLGASNRAGIPELSLGPTTTGPAALGQITTTFGCPRSGGFLAQSA